MKKVKQVAGIIWMMIALITFVILLQAAYIHIQLHSTKDINKPLPWIIIITIFTPIVMGLFLFGWYAFKGAYDADE